MASINFVNEGKTLDVLPGTNLREAAFQSGIPLVTPIHRIFYLNIRIGPLSMFSDSDVVEVEGKGVNARSDAEEKALTGRFLRKHNVGSKMRLASQVIVNGDLLVRTRVRREIDMKLTKEQAGYLALISGFAVVMLLMFALVGLDLIKKM